MHFADLGSGTAGRSLTIAFSARIASRIPVAFVVFVGTLAVFFGNERALDYVIVTAGTRFHSASVASQSVDIF